MKISLLSLFLLTLFIGNAQADLNQYKYIIVPKKLDGFRNENQYQTSTLIKYLLVENGFAAVYEDALPDDLNRNRCLGAVLGMKDESGMFATKLTLILKDCQAKVVFETEEGSSKLKDYKSAYDQAIRSAFISLKALNYAFTPKAQEEAPMKISFKNDVKQVEEEDAKAPKGKVLVQEASTEQQTYKEIVTEPSNLNKDIRNKEGDENGLLPNTILYAQEITNGYQLVDSTPKIVLRMIKSTIADVYIAKTSNREGMVYNKEGKWFFEYVSNDEIVAQELQIKF